MASFLDRIHKTISEQSALCLGIDPSESELREWGLPNSSQGVLDYGLKLVDAAAGNLGFVKPQVAFFERFGSAGLLALEQILAEARAANLFVIADAKRGDIGSTAEHYAKEAYVRYQADAVTVNPYMGTDSLMPYLQYESRGIFVLCRTSNAGGDDFQMLSTNHHPLYMEVAKQASDRWNQHEQVGLVVGATYPKEIEAVRHVAKTLPLLIPGIGAQGGDLVATVHAGKTANGGMLINSSRAIIYAGHDEHWQQAAAQAARQTKDDINAAF